MIEKNIQIKQNTETGIINLFPQTLAQLVRTGSGLTVEEELVSLDERLTAKSGIRIGADIPEDLKIGEIFLQTLA